MAVWQINAHGQCSAARFSSAASRLLYSAGGVGALGSDSARVTALYEHLLVLYPTLHSLTGAASMATNTVQPTETAQVEIQYMCARTLRHYRRIYKKCKFASAKLQLPRVRICCRNFSVSSGGSSGMLSGGSRTVCLQNPIYYSSDYMTYTTVWRWRNMAHPLGVL